MHIRQVGAFAHTFGALDSDKFAWFHACAKKLNMGFMMQGSLHIVAPGHELLWKTQPLHLHLLIKKKAKFPETAARVVKSEAPAYHAHLPASRALLNSHPKNLLRHKFSLPRHMQRIYL